MKNTKKISHADLVELLLNIEKNGGLKNTFFSYKINTDALKNEFNKKSRVTGEPTPFSSIRKISVGCARLGVNYKKAVENKAEKITGEKVTFEPEKMKGKSHFQGSAIIAQSDKEPEKLYLIFDARSSRSAKSVYFGDGQKIEKNEWTDYMKPKKPAFLPWRTVTVSNIKEAKINGTKYILE